MIAELLRPRTKEELSLPFRWPLERHDKVLAKQVMSGRVVIKELVMAPTKDAKNYNANFEGGERHQLLCAVAAQWLEEHGHEWSSRKGTIYGGGQADVASKDKTIFVECGNANTPISDRIWRGIMYGGVSVIWLPFQDCLDFQPKVMFPSGHCSTKAFLFTLSPRARPYKDLRPEKRRMVERIKPEPKSRLRVPAAPSPVSATKQDITTMADWVAGARHLDHLW